MDNNNQNTENIGGVPNNDLFVNPVSPNPTNEHPVELLDDEKPVDMVAPENKDVVSVPTVEPVVEPSPVVETPGDMATSQNTDAVPAVSAESTSLTVAPEAERPENIGLDNYVSEPPKDTNVPIKDPDKLEKIEEKYKPPTKGKTFFLLIVFIAMIAFVLFLPEIEKMITERQDVEDDYTKTKISTGKLLCSLDTNTAELDKSYDLTFQYTNSKLDSVQIVNYTKGNASLDEKVLDEMNASCEKLESISKYLAGVTVRCTYTPGKFIEEQIFQLAYVDENELGSAFSEAGGMNPEYKYQQNIDGIEKNLLASGYKCEREK